MGVGRLSVKLMAQQSDAIEQRQQTANQPLTASVRKPEGGDTNQTKLELADGSVAVGFNYSAAQLKPDQPVRYQSGQVVTKTGLNR